MAELELNLKCSCGYQVKQITKSFFLLIKKIPDLLCPQCGKKLTPKEEKEVENIYWPEVL